MMPRLRVDRGAIRFVFAGANIMCPGLTSAGATLHDEVDEDTPVVRMQRVAAAVQQQLIMRTRRTGHLCRGQGKRVGCRLDKDVDRGDA